MHQMVIRCEGENPVRVCGCILFQHYLCIAIRIIYEHSGEKRENGSVDIAQGIRSILFTNGSAPGLT